MAKKTISGHYGSVFALNHNNRVFTPKNVDPSRSKWNYYCVTAGDDAYIDFKDPRYVKDFWSRYQELNYLYWSNRALADALEEERYRENLRYLRRCRQLLEFNPENAIELFFYLLILPLLIYTQTVLTINEYEEKWEHHEFRYERRLQIEEFKYMKMTAREIVAAYGREASDASLMKMDSLVREAAASAQNYVDASTRIALTQKEPVRFATLEEIYEKVYEPSFRAFQAKQRPCRRFEGTYLEYIREGQHEIVLKRMQNRNTRNRKISEAIELLIGIGDMNNTGYFSAFSDAKKSEVILKDYCDYLMSQKNICFITTAELNDPEWIPPFKHGLIILNLAVHCDEATPGIHLTFIPYSRGCKRGPEVQASLGRAMTGMGYPSTWKDVLDENGRQVPKRNKNNEIIYNPNGTIRYLQEPDQQGIIDWIENQKKWIQNEMEQRYGWEREYKGSHPRGNLSTPDYQVARAEERRREAARQIDEMLLVFLTQVDDQINRLNTAIDKVWRNGNDWEMVLRYLNSCPEEEYKEHVKRAAKYLDSLPMREQEKMQNHLHDLIYTAEKKKANQSSKPKQAEQAHQR